MPCTHYSGTKIGRAREYDATVHWDAGWRNDLRYPSIHPSINHSQTHKTAQNHVSTTDPNLGRHVLTALNFVHRRS